MISSNSIEIDKLKKLYNYYISNDIFKRGYHSVNDEFYSYATIRDIVHDYVYNYASEKEQQLYRNQRRKYETTVPNMMNLNNYNALYEAFINLVQKKEFSQHNLKYASIFMERYANEIEMAQYDEFVKKYYKKIFDDCEKKKWIVPLLKISAAELNIGYHYYRQCAITYINREMNMSYEEYCKSFMFYTPLELDFFNIYDHILNMKTSQEVNNYIETIDFVKIVNLKKYLPNYMDYLNKDGNVNEDRLDLIKQKLLSLIDNYLNSIKDDPAEDMILFEGKKYIKLYLDGNFRDVQSFCDYMGFNRTYFSRRLSAVKNNDPKLYEFFKSSANKINHNRHILYKNQIECLAKSIREGFDGRPFDIVDYFMTTKISLDEISEVARKVLGRMDHTTIISFTQKYSNVTNMTTNYIFKEKYTLLVNGIEVTASEEDKKAVISYLENNQIPLISYTYYAAMRRYLNGTLIPKKEHVLVNKNGIS